MAFRTNKVPVLQEKSASGAVATFNTALAMPLSSCNIAVNAWQEGSGNPSPVNDRPIHGFSEVNVTPNNVVHTIQLGQEVYGAEVDVVNGVAHCTHSKVVFDGSQDENWIYYSNAEAFYLESAFDTNVETDENSDQFMCNRLHRNSAISRSGNMLNMPDNSFNNQKVEWMNRLWIKMTQFNEDAEAFKTWLQNNNLEIKFPLSTPFDIQITPAQIQTLIGNNTIFADTGDIDLTFKDLDIAKRGNFREVFKLPS